MDIRFKICAWHWLLLTLKTRSIKLQRRFEQTTLTFIGFFKKPTEWRLSNGSQFCACYASKDITNSRCAWLREGFGNIWDVNVFVSRVAVSLRIPGLKKKSLVKITSPVYNCRMVVVYTMDKLVRVLRPELWSCCLQPEPPFYVLWTLFPRLCIRVLCP